MKAKIKKALDECRAAFAANQDAKSAWCCHHEVLWELLTEPYEKRISYILSYKEESEQAIRFQNFRPCTSHDAITALDADYKAKRASLDADYKAKCAPLYADYDAKRTSLYADYKAKRASLDADSKAKCAPLYADYNAKCASLYADYNAKRASLYADYDAKRTPLDADYKAKCAPLDADYNAKRTPLYRADVPSGTWNGTSIFNK